MIVVLVGEKREGGYYRVLGICYLDDRCIIM